jgi:hypothetical protein
MSDTPTGHPFSICELATLAAALDQIIPSSADGRLPAAGFLADGEPLAGIVRLLPGLDLALAGGLGALEERARQRGAASYAALAADDRKAVLDEVAAADGGFVPSLMFIAFTTYYVDERVVAALDLEPRPPHPQGFAMLANDLSLLEPVRRRGALYREC